MGCHCGDGRQSEDEMSRPVPLHRETHPLLDVEGCFGCKAVTIGFGPVPGGARDKTSHLRQREKDLHRYRDKRQAGEHPDGTTRQAMDRSDRKQDLWSRREQDVADYNPPEAVAKIKKALVNKV